MNKLEKNSKNANTYESVPDQDKHISLVLAAFGPFRSPTQASVNNMRPCSTGSPPRRSRVAQAKSAESVGNGVCGESPG